MNLNILHRIIILVVIFSVKSLFAHVILNYPSGGETFESGETVTVEWQIEIDHGECQWHLSYSSDGGNSWESIITGLAKEKTSYKWVIPQISTDEAKIRVIQDNSDYPNFGDESGNFMISTTTDIEKQPNQPDNFRLFSAYPNPFNSSTVIGFQIPQNSNVKVEIFNIVGHKIETLLNRELQAGRHQVKWNAENLPSGLYFYTITTDAVTETRRLALTR